MKEVKNRKIDDFESDFSQDSKDNETNNNEKEKEEKNNIKFHYSPGKHSRIDSKDIKEIYCLVENRINEELKVTNIEEHSKIDLIQFKHFLKRAEPDAIDKLIKGEITYHQLKARVLRDNDCFIEVLDDFKDKYGKQFFTIDQNFK